MFFSNRPKGNTSKTNGQFRRLMGFECLEDRTLLSINMPNEVVVDFSETGIPEDEIMAAYTGPGSEPLATIDEGDFYYYFDEQIPLDRVADEVLIRVDPSFDPADVVAALTGPGGALEGFEGTAFNDPRVIALSIPFGSEVEPPADILAAAASEEGVLWSAPVFVVEDTRDYLWLTGEVIVALEPGVDPETFFASGFDSWQPFFQNQYIATPSLGGGLGALFAANTLSTDPDVEWATPNFYTNFEVEQNDPLFGDQWHLENTGQNNALVGADAALEGGWDVTTGSTDIVIAVLDNGVQLDHPDFNIFTNTGEIPGNAMDDDGNGFVDDVNGWNFFNNNNNPNPVSDDDNHGTAVAGIVAAVGDNNIGVTGAIHTAQILPIKIAQDPGNGGGFITFPQIARAVYYAAGAVLDAMGNVVDTWRGADILVNSWGGGTNNAALTAAFDWAATNGRDGKGVTSFNATGNSAAGTQPGLNYSSLTLNGVTPGNWQFEWRYVKNGTNAAGEDSVWLGNIQLPNGTTQRFDTPGLPAGWTTSGNANWAVIDDPQHTYGTGRYAARAGTIGNSQTSNLRSPTITVAATGALRFNYWVSSETGADGVILYASLNGGAFVPQWNTSGVPLITTNPNYPASIASTIAVGATTDWDYRSHYSQYGATLDIVAPSGGGNASITTTDRTGAAGYSSTLDYTSTFSGTSAATPLAAGIAALMLSTNPDLTTAQIRTILRASADKVGGNNGLTAYNTNGFNQFYGYGKVDASGAVDTTLATLGDFDRDQDVDGRDFLAWQRSFGSTATPVGTGADGDLSGTIGAGDLTIWQDHYGETIPAPLVAASTSSVNSEQTGQLVSVSTISEDTPPQNVTHQLPSNLLSIVLPSPERKTPITLLDEGFFDSGAAGLQTFDNELFDLLADLRSREQESDIAVNRDDLDNHTVVDEVFQAFDSPLLAAQG
jgi:subtilisin family serine protease